MKEELNIAAILREKPEGTKLWTPIIGDCELIDVEEDEMDDQPITVFDKTVGNAYFMKNGKYAEEGEVCLFPSKQMQDWEKFAWKKGDVLSCGVDSLCIFNKWKNDEYTEFNAEYATPNYSGAVLKTKDWIMVTNEDTIKQHISKIEEIKGGKLNLETLEIEQLKPEFEDGDIVFVACGKGFTESTFIYKTDDVFDIHDKAQCYAAVFNKENKLTTCGSVLTYGRTLRPATDSEKQQLFSALEKEGKRWNPDALQIEDLPTECDMKAFDKVLARFDEDCEWMPDFFYYYDKTCSEMPYVCIANGRAIECIPYNEETKHLLGTIDEWKGGEG